MTDHTLTVTGTTDSRTAPPRAARRTSRVVALAAAAVAVTVALVATAGPANAYVWSNRGGLGAATSSCESDLHTSTVTAAAYPEQGYASQTVDVRFRWYHYGTGQWSTGGWMRFRTGQSLYNDWMSRRGKWAIYAQYRFWRGNAWSPIVEERLVLTQVGLVPGTSTTGWTCRT